MNRALICTRFHGLLYRAIINASFYRNGSSASIKRITDPIVLANGGSYYICWHPEKSFPYEFTKPLPSEKKEKKHLLKNMDTSSSLYEKPNHPDTVAQEMAKLTYTTKHRWFPRSRDKYAKKTTPDREYL